MSPEAINGAKIRPENDRYLDDSALLSECEVDTYRASGPGGQKRNKTDSAVRLRHRATGLQAIAEESRSQAENRSRALKRLRKTLALRLRRPVEEGVPQAVRACVGKNGRLQVGQRDSRYRALFAVALAGCAGSLGLASRLEIARAHPLQSERELTVEANVCDVRVTATYVSVHLCSVHALEFAQSDRAASGEIAGAEAHAESATLPRRVRIAREIDRC